MSLSDDNQADIIDAFNTTSIYLELIMFILTIYPSELQLKANTSIPKLQFWTCICPFLMILFLLKFTR